MSDSIGSDFEDFLEKEGIAEDVSLLARERVGAWLLAQDPVSESPPADD